ncbi:MAG TPA: DNA polymerase IV [Psychromonas hadalis]|nr:DNA polymerase IV [Psychromonas hadalis]
MSDNKTKKSTKLKRARKIIHIDMDCFFAAVEMRDNPEYQNVPLAIGGATDRRSVLSTCNYLARSYGCHSAMPSFKAKQLCPQLIIIPGRMQVYVDVSKKLREIFYRYTALVEPLSLDEAFLDVTDCTVFKGSATYIAQDIRRAIFAELQLTASAGIANCKFLAKIASDENKPNGQCVIVPDEVDDFVKTLPLKKIPGVGKVAQQKLALHDLFTCADLQKFDQNKVIKEFGKLGEGLILFCRGIDEREVVVNRERKSVAVEHTFTYDLIGIDACSAKIAAFYIELEQRLEKVLQTKQIIKLGVKVKFSDFTIKSAERKSSELSLSLFQMLLQHIIDKTMDKSVRLLGVSVGLAPKEADQQHSVQLNLLD